MQVPQTLWEASSSLRIPLHRVHLRRTPHSETCRREKLDSLRPRITSSLPLRGGRKVAFHTTRNACEGSQISQGNKDRDTPVTMTCSLPRTGRPVPHKAVVNALGPCSLGGRRCQRARRGFPRAWRLCRNCSGNHRQVSQPFLEKSKLKCFLKHRCTGGCVRLEQASRIKNQNRLPNSMQSTGACAGFTHLWPREVYLKTQRSLSG